MADSVLTFDQEADKAADWSRELTEFGFKVTLATSARDVRQLLAEKQFSIVIADERVRSLAGGAFAEWSFFKNARPKFVWVTREFSATSVLNLCERNDLVLPSPLHAGVALRAVRLLLSRGDDVAEFSMRYELSPREAAVLRLAIAGLNNDEAAAELDCSRATVASFWNRIFKKTGVRGQRDVIVLLLQTSRTSRSGVFPVSRLNVYDVNIDVYQSPKKRLAT
jgi:DNA-binding NarL/FixJ family response regulator